jgi:hypothetical protein
VRKSVERFYLQVIAKTKEIKVEIKEEEPEVVIVESPKIKFSGASSLGLVQLEFSETMKIIGAVPDDFCTLELVSNKKEARVFGVNKPSKRRLEEDNELGFTWSARMDGALKLEIKINFSNPLLISANSNTDKIVMVTQNTIDWLISETTKAPVEGFKLEFDLPI